MSRTQICVTLAAVLAVLSGSIASAHAASRDRLPDPSATASKLATGVLLPADADASASRRKRPRFMPMYKARNNARYAAYQVYLDPEFDFDDYGVGKCRRLNRSAAYCYTWAAGDYYDDLGYFVDTMICDWFTTSRYDRSGRMKVKIEQPDCVWASEI